MVRCRVLAMPQLTSISGTPPATASPPLCTQHPLPARSLASSCPGLHPEASTDTLGRGTALGLQGLHRGWEGWQWQRNPLVTASGSVGSGAGAKPVQEGLPHVPG